MALAATDAKDLSNAVLASPLVTEHRGFAVYEDLVEKETFRDLYAEAMSAFWTAEPEEELLDDRGNGRGGHPEQRLLRGVGGSVQTSFYQSADLSQFLSDELGLMITPTGRRGSFSYHIREGDFIGLHLDNEACDVAVLVLLYDNSDPDDPAGSLVLYPDYMGGPLSDIRSNPGAASLAVKQLPGQTIVMFGGLVPHFVRPVREGQVRVMSVLCFRASAPLG
jgi:hypothetical protein